MPPLLVTLHFLIIISMTNILVIEDDTTIRDTLEFSLKLAGFDVITAKEGETGLRLAEDKNPDLILLDLMLPKVDGFTICKNLRMKNEAVPILMLTALDSEKDKLKGFGAGADDYITKPFSTEELLARIAANLRRAKQRAALTNQNEPIIFGDVVIDRKKHLVTVGDNRVELRPKEFFLLELMASNPNQVFSRMELAEKVWGYDFLSSSRTIDVHIKRIREKIEKLSAYTCIQTVHTLGYRFEVTKK